MLAGGAVGPPYCVAAGPTAPMKSIDFHEVNSLPDCVDHGMPSGYS